MGFTLIELMVTVAVVAILAAIAFPSFKSTLQSNQVSTATNDLIASFSLARSEAVRSNAGGGLCASSTGTGCGVDWNSGWMVWTDSNGDGLVSTSEPVVRYSQARSKIAVTSTAATIAFDASGRARGGEQKIDIKPADGTYPLRCVTMNVTGQTSVESKGC